MYGCIKSARLFWEHLSTYLAKLGFVQNKYDLCVANKTINNNTCTIAWHVDDLKISHKEEKVVRDIIKQLEDEYGKMTVVTGDEHTNCGMNFVFRDSSVIINMKDYLKEAIEEFEIDYKKTVNSPAATYLFEVNENQTQLDDERKKLFHQITAKLLFVSKCGRPDIQVAMSFLTTRVTKPDEDDWKKLLRLMQYINCTINLELTLSIKSFNSIKWWVDASYAIHLNMRGHTGATMTLGKGSIFSASTKQKLNSKSSTKAELIGMNNIIGQILWTQNFLAEQGYTVTPSTIYQDNKSAMLLEHNDIMSSSKRTKHIDIRFYFIKDKIDKNEVNVIYCPTGDMLGDYFTKPLQGTQFVRFRDAIMGVECFNSIGKERVEE